MSGIRLYKYLPAVHARSMLERGELLFSNLTRFKQMEHEARGDVMEGCHVDNPRNDVVISNLTTGKITTGPFSFRHSIRDEKVFVFCVARRLGGPLFRAFDTDCCVEILDVDEFARRVGRAVRRLNFIDSAGVLHRPVTYFRPDAPCDLDVSDGKNIPFLKHVDFAEQDEYRFVFARKGALKPLSRIIINQFWDTEPDHLKGEARTLLLQVGPLHDIVCFHQPAEAAE